MNRYSQKSAPQCTFCCPHLHKMKMDIENIVMKHLKCVACMTALFLFEGWLRPLNKGNNKITAFRAILQRESQNS